LVRASVRGRRAHARELHDRAARLASWLAAGGVRAGDRVAQLLHNGFELPESLLACHRIGACAVPINFRLAADESPTSSTTPAQSL
jgi:fatty-acyl-CoA synthase